MSDPTMNTAPAPRRRRLFRAVLAAGILVGGAGSLAVAMGGPHGGPFGGFWGPRSPEQRLERMQALARRALDSVGATSEQENRIHDIIAGAFAAVRKEGRPPHEMRRQFVDLLKAPTVDRAAVEALRAEMVGSLDARSKIVSNALLDASGQLSAEQRTKLAERVAGLMDRHRGFGGWHRPGGDRDGRHGGPGEDGPRGDGPREGGPDRN